MRCPRDPLEVVCDEVHLNRHAEVIPKGQWTRVGETPCCWADPDGSLWRIDVVDGVAVTWCNSEPIPF
jgi:hypothetical protein